MKPTYEELEATVKKLKIDADCYKKGMEASNARLVQLAAENAGLKAAGNKMFLSAISLMEDPELKIDHARDIKDWEGIKTPATEAYLTEVRAQGVEMMAAEADQLMNEFGDDSYKVMVTADLQRFANAFAAQLRKGAAL